MHCYIKLIDSIKGKGSLVTQWNPKTGLLNLQRLVPVPLWLCVQVLHHQEQPARAPLQKTRAYGTALGGPGEQQNLRQGGRGGKIRNNNKRGGWV